MCYEAIDHRACNKIKCANTFLKAKPEIQKKIHFYSTYTKKATFLSQVREDQANTHTQRHIYRCK